MTKWTQEWFDYIKSCSDQIRIILTEAVIIIRRAGAYNLVEVEEFIAINEENGMISIDCKLLEDEYSWSMTEVGEVTIMFPSKFITDRTLNEDGLRMWAIKFHRPRLEKEAAIVVQEAIKANRTEEENERQLLKKLIDRYGIPTE